MELVDDHFMHVAWGRQLLYGRWPVRDMVVLGLPLQSALSAAFEWAVGYRLLSEGLIVALAFATSAVLTFVLARGASGVTWVGALAAAMQVAVAPRTYGFPKILLYAAAILALWMYVDRPSPRRIASLGAVVAVGFYLRHDHGLYLGLVATGVVTLRHLREWTFGMRRLTALAAVCAVAIGPYFIYAHSHVGVVAYINDLRAIAEREHQANRFEGWPRWPLQAFRDVARLGQEPGTATIGIRWSSTAPQEDRRAAALRYGLQLQDDIPLETGRFLLTDISKANVLALIGDPAIEDTSNVDRSRGDVPRQGLRLGSLHVLAGLDTPAAAAAFLFYVFLAILPITLVALMRLRPDDDAGRWAEHVKIAAVVMVGIVTAVGFLREPLTIRISDAVVAPLVLAAWWIGRWLRNAGGAPPLWRRVVPLLVALVIIIPFTRSVAVVGAVSSRVERVRHLPAIWQQISVSPPFEGWKATGSAKYQAVRYVRECTAADDPLLVLWFAPDLYYYSGRPFAGRLGFYLEGYWTTADHERANVAAIERDRPTIVLMEPGRRATDLYTYPQLLDYVSTAYHPIGEVVSGDGRRVRLHARNDRTPSRVDAATGFPCFTAGAEPAPPRTGSASHEGSRE